MIKFSVIIVLKILVSAVRSRPRAPSKSLGFPRLLLYLNDSGGFFVNVVLGQKMPSLFVKVAQFLHKNESGINR